MTDFERRKTAAVMYDTIKNMLLIEHLIMAGMKTPAARDIQQSRIDAIEVGLSQLKKEIQQ